MGARDRRETRDLCYTYFRIGNVELELNFENRLNLACYLCEPYESATVNFLYKKNGIFEIPTASISFEEKIEIVKKAFPSFQIEEIFPMHAHLSSSLRKKNWYLSFLRKPLVWIRIRKSKEKHVIEELNKEKIPFTIYEEGIISFEGGIKLEETISWQKGYFEIQDYSSQQTRKFFSPSNGEQWWDVCAGSGGKSLLLLEEENNIKLFATDIRESILKNYSERMKRNGYTKFATMVVDLTKENYKSNIQFEGIIADVPCSGSGTWSRSPEFLSKKFDLAFIDDLVLTQRKIVKNSIENLKRGKPLVYITCSAFTTENEGNVSYFLKNFPIRLEKSTYLEGFERGADTLFVARFTKI
jgi:16S rRNA (cytosine967-C5)-methyltransferase